MAVSKEDKEAIEEYVDAVNDLADWLESYGSLHRGYDTKVVSASKKLRSRVASATAHTVTHLMTDVMVHVDGVVEELFMDDPEYCWMVQDWDDEAYDILREAHRLSVIIPGLGFATPYEVTEPASLRDTTTVTSGLPAEEALGVRMEALAMDARWCADDSGQRRSRYHELGRSLHLKITGDCPDKEAVVSEAVDQGLEELGVKMENPYEVSDRQRWIPQELARMERLGMALRSSIRPTKF